MKRRGALPLHPWLASLLLGHAVTGFAGEASPAATAAWPEAVFRWHYNPALAPDWLDEATAEAWMRAAAESWQACGVRVEYLGRTEAEPAPRDGRNVAGWSRDLPRPSRGVTRLRRNAARLLEADIRIAGARQEFQRHPRLLRKVLAHEFGHALGLRHADGCGQVMSFGPRCRQEDPDHLPMAPAAGDLEQCQRLYDAAGTPRLPH